MNCIKAFFMPNILGGGIFFDKNKILFFFI
ncbi:MAG: hypothetical protein RL757_131 [Bacteroidota bacterium]|jgi:hypothetical protein